MNLDPQKSAQNCGCDQGADWICDRHTIVVVNGDRWRVDREEYDKVYQAWNDTTDMERLENGPVEVIEWIERTGEFWGTRVE